MSAPDEIRQLADDIEAMADVDSDLAAVVTNEHSADALRAREARLRAAAVALRDHANLLDAIGDPDNLRLLADTFDLPLLRRIADAVTPTPTTQRETPISDGLEQARASARALPADLQDAVRRSGTRSPDREHP